VKDYRLIVNMPALKYQILALLILVTFGLVLTNKDKIAIAIMVFSIPFAAAPFGLSEAFHFQLGLNAFLIWSIWLGRKIKSVVDSHSREISWKAISPKTAWLYYFLFAGLLLAILIDRPDVYSKYVNKTESIVNFSLFIVTTILFIKILVNYRSDEKFQTQLLFVFSYKPNRLGKHASRFFNTFFSSTKILSIFWILG